MISFNRISGFHGYFIPVLYIRLILFKICLFL